MPTQRAPLRRLIDAVRAIGGGSGNELDGHRQVTRTQLIQFLARELGVNEASAAQLFNDLNDAGIIDRRDEALEEETSVLKTQRWSIDSDDESGAVAKLEPTIRVTREDRQEPMAIELLRRAVRCRASDVHLDPFGDEVEVRFRIDGRLEHYCRLSDQIGRQLMSQLKVLAKLNPVEPFHAHEGRLSLPVGLSEYDVRITTVPVAQGEAVSLRLLRRDQIIRPINTLGFSEQCLEQIHGALCAREGLVLISGPSGSGKTTTLYSLVHHMDDGQRNIVTIEDPPEYLVPEFLQLQIDRRHGLSTSSRLRTVMRMDADVIVLGEIRDAEAAAAALQAASCGKHVFTTLHAPDAAAAITALRNMSIDSVSLASSLRAIISQRLLRRACQKCRKERPLSEVDRDRFIAQGITPPDRVLTSAGCEECRGLGFRERIGVFEVVSVSPEIATAIADGKLEHELRQLMRASGAASLSADCLRKATEGIATLDEVISSLGNHT